MESGWRFGDDVVRRVDLEGEKIKQEKEVALTQLGQTQLSAEMDFSMPTKPEIKLLGRRKMQMQQPSRATQW